jgi:hypothetical protein
MIIRWEKKEKWGAGVGMDFAQFEILPTKQLHYSSL